MNIRETNLDEEQILTPEQRDRLVNHKAKMKQMAAARELWTDEDFAAESERLEIEIASFPVTLCPPPGYRVGPNMRRDSSLI